MSKIQATLADATDVTPSKRNDEKITDQAYMKRLALGVQDLPDAEWDKLPEEAKVWFNAAADAISTNTDIPAFPDVDPPASSTRRRGSASSETPKEITSKDVKKGDMVEVVNSRDRVYAGKVVEADDQGLVLDVDGKDVEIDHDKVKSIKLQGGSGNTEAAGGGKAEPEVGDTVEVVTKRGKTVVGNIKELTEEVIVLTLSTGEDDEYDIDRVQSIKVKVKNAAGKGVSGGAAATSGRRASNTTSTASSAAAPASSARGGGGGVSVTLRMRELIIDNMDAKKDGIAEMLKKEGHEFKQATLDLTYGEVHKIIGLLRERKLIK